MAVIKAYIVFCNIVSLKQLIEERENDGIHIQRSNSGFNESYL